MSSGYWFNEMQRISNLIDIKKVEIYGYEKYKSKLLELQSKLSSISSDIRVVGNFLSDGGFSYDGDIPFKEEFISEKTSLDDSISELQSIINGTASKITDLQEEQKKFEKDYSNAKNNYNAALKKENK